MNVSNFAEEYEHMADEPLLCMWADRETLVPEAALALENELHKRGLKKEDAARVKKRLDALTAREASGALSKQVAAAKYERNMRHFIGTEEPKFYSPYSSRDIRGTFAYTRHKYRVWKAFRDHTGHWPVFSIWFHCLSWIAFLALFVAIVLWSQNLGVGWMLAAILGGVGILYVLRELGSRFMRKLDWKRYGKP